LIDLHALVDSALVGGSRSGSGACQARYERRCQDPKVIGKRLLAQINRCLHSQRVVKLPDYSVHEAAVSKTGWVGRTNTKASEKKKMGGLFESGKVWDVLRLFERIYYEKQVSLLVNPFLHLKLF
jgi:hypothetical protein